MVFVLFVAVLLGIWRAYIAPYLDQKATLRLLESLGATVEAEAASDWIYRLALGDGRNLTLVNVADCDSPDEYIGAVARLPRLRTLVVGGPNFCDEHLAQLRRLSTLEYLVLDSTVATLEAQDALQQALPQLKILHSQRRIVKDSREKSAGPTCGDHDHFVLGDDAIAANRPPRVSFGDPVPKSALRDLEGLTTEGPLEQKLLAEGVIQHAVWARPRNKQELAQVASAGYLLVLILPPGGITEAELAAISRMRRLMWLDFGESQCSAPGLGLLAPLASKLEILWFQHITDEGLGYLPPSASLRSLHLYGAQVSDVGMECLSRFPNLTQLSVSATKITDRGLVSIAKLQSLRWLFLSNTLITDQGVATISALPNLSELALSKTEVTDAGLTHLTKMPKLSSLDVSGTKITAAGLGKLWEKRKAKGLPYPGGPLPRSFSDPDP